VTPKKRVLFICSGNYYRSRLAEILFNHEAAAGSLAWEAGSRGLLKARELKGLSGHTTAYLKAAELAHLAAEPRDPISIDVQDLTDSALIIAMCREEHQPMIEQKFLSLAKALHESGTRPLLECLRCPGAPPGPGAPLGGWPQRPQPACRQRHRTHRLGGQRIGPRTGDPLTRYIQDYVITSTRPRPFSAGQAKDPAL
jgi:Protein-tyrosine-phosphatase